MEKIKINLIKINFDGLKLSKELTVVRFCIRNFKGYIISKV